jgi:cyclopropane fatty-acyl-phospholipid synthase-like methyltransferase
MIDWEAFYASHPLSFGGDEYLKQAGHTINGRPISEAQFELLVETMQDLLDLREGDVLLDLCCGNGIFTKELAKRCKRVVGVDFSRPMLEIAERTHRPQNVTYHQMNALAVDSNSLVGSMRFDKVVMCGALQHFSRDQLQRLVGNMVNVTSDGRVIVFLLVPDRRKRWVFYDTPGKRVRHLARQLLGRERMGTWWTPEDFEGTCQRLGLRSSFHDMDARLHPSRYRFDVRIT